MPYSKAPQIIVLWFPESQENPSWLLAFRKPKYDNLRRSGLTKTAGRESVPAGLIKLFCNLGTVPN